MIKEAVPAASDAIVDGMHQSAATTDLEQAWRICADLFCAATTPPSAATAAASFERELLFCLLSGHGISYEHALSAAAHVRRLEPFGAQWTPVGLLARVQRELALPQFEPLRSDGRLRRYRFPRRKAELVVGAREWLIAVGEPIAALSAIDDERARRRFLCGCPGVGLKTASWLLRNLGLASELAILDVHLIRALRAAGRVAALALPRDYELAERAFLDWCRELDAPAAAFDLFVWEWQRGSLSEQ